jgi:hypothetical protein
MKRIPQRPARPTRHSTVRVTGLDGTTYQGDGESLALAMRDLGRRHRAGQPAADQGDRGEASEAVGATRWRVTPAGAAYLAGLRGAGATAAGPAVPAAVLRRLLAELDGWPARATNFGDALDRLSDLLAAYAGEAPDRDVGEDGR